jgi:hypothetical protein
MPAMKRVLYAVAGAVLAILPVVAAAAPSPSPTLDRVLAAAPTSDYVEADATASGVIEGPFDAHHYAATSTTNAAQIQVTLERDGFVGGYGRTWIQRASQHVLVEAVIAFTGGDGAKKWLAASELADKADPNYQHPVSITGIDSYYGAHFYYTSSKAYGDGFAFVKGNDFFFIIAVSAKNDTAPIATTQTTAQYNFAPSDTIPSSQWPENASRSVTFNVGFLIVPIIVVILLIALVALVVMRRSRRAAPAMVQAAAPAMGAPAVIQMSPDGRFWWDGQGWKDTEQQIPPNVQRSGDGQSWWDGRGWRPVPRAS